MNTFLTPNSDSQAGRFSSAIWIVGAKVKAMVREDAAVNTLCYRVSSDVLQTARPRGDASGRVLGSRFSEDSRISPLERAGQEPYWHTK